ncbi:MAG: addiction module protein [Bacteroidetes bacterium]|nr:addiction module protein [Bacteroidota bacterium]
MSKLEKIQEEILSLSTEERELISIFLKSAQDNMEADYTQAWNKELQRRIDELDNGKADLVSSESAVAEIRKKLFK